MLHEDSPDSFHQHKEHKFFIKHRIFQIIFLVFSLCIFTSAIYVLGYRNGAQSISISQETQKELIQSFVASNNTGEYSSSGYQDGYHDGYTHGYEAAIVDAAPSSDDSHLYTSAYGDGYAAAENDYSHILENQYALGCIDTLLEYGHISDAATYASQCGDAVWEDFLDELLFYGYTSEYEKYSEHVQPKSEYAPSDELSTNSLRNGILSPEEAIKALGIDPSPTPTQWRSIDGSFFKK